MHGNNFLRKYTTEERRREGRKGARQTLNVFAKYNDCGRFCISLLAVVIEEIRSRDNRAIIATIDADAAAATQSSSFDLARSA